MADMEQLLMAGAKETQPPLSEFADNLAVGYHGGTYNIS